jgi:hypothetical protein
MNAVKNFDVDVPSIQRREDHLNDIFLWMKNLIWCSLFWNFIFRKFSIIFNLSQYQLTDLTTDFTKTKHKHEHHNHIHHERYDSIQYQFENTFAQVVWILLVYIRYKNFITNYIKLNFSFELIKISRLLISSYIMYTDVCLF